MDAFRRWVTANRLTGWIGVTAGFVLAAIITRNLISGLVAVSCGVFLVVMSLVVNWAIDRWERRRGTSA